MIVHAEGHTEVVRRLIQAGADLELAPEDRVTAVGVACALDHTEVLSVLADAGAKLESPGTGGILPLHLAAMQAQSTSIVRALLARGVNVNAQDEDGDSALCMVLMAAGHKLGKNFSEVALELLDGGADANMRDSNGMPPLIIALQPGGTCSRDVVLRLLSAGAHSGVSHRGVTASALARARGDAALEAEILACL